MASESATLRRIRTTVGRQKTHTIIPSFHLFRFVEDDDDKDAQLAVPPTVDPECDYRQGPAPRICDPWAIMVLL